jgi:hypothetical protein
MFRLANETGSDYACGMVKVAPEVSGQTPVSPSKSALSTSSVGPIDVERWVHHSSPTAGQSSHTSAGDVSKPTYATRLYQKLRELGLLR